MPKQQTEYLIDLIKRLSKSEKRAFKLFANRQNSQDDKLFMIVFDYIDKSDDYDEETLLKKNPQIKKIQLSNIKANLYRQLLTNLRLLYRNNQQDIFIREQIDFAKVLHAKGMYRASLDITYKAKQLALEREEFSQAYTAIEFERMIESQYVTGSMAEKAEDIAAESKMVTDHLIINNELANLSIKLYGLYLKYGYVRDKRDSMFITEYFQSHLPKHNMSSLGFYDKIYLYQAHTWYYYMQQDFANNFRYSQKWVDLFEMNPEKIKQNYALYLKGLHNLLSATYMADRSDKFTYNFDKLKLFGSQHMADFNENERSIYALTEGIHLLNYVFITGQYTAGTKMVLPLEQVLKSEEHDWDMNRVMIFYYKLACVHFGASDNSRCIDYLNLIINSPIYDLRNDIQCFARILSLIAHYELGNDLLISYQIKSVYRFLSKMEELHSVHKEIFTFLRRIPSILPAQLKQEFLTLRNRLEKYTLDPFERRPFLYLDIIAWLDAKIEGKPIEEIIGRG